MSTAINIYALSLAIILSNVMSWTVDLAEVTKFFDQQQLHELDVNEDSNSINNDNENFNEVIYTSNYAESFGYHRYKTKEVNRVITSGSLYLDGLSKALAIYKDILDNCTRNATQLDRRNVSTQTIKCDEAEKNRDHVEKLSEIALITTNKFRDDAVKTDKDGDDEEANLMQLAWTLDRLAFLTGYDITKLSEIEKNAGYNSSITSTEAREPSKTKHFQDVEILEQVENGPAVSMYPQKRFAKDESKPEQREFEILKQDDFSISNLPPISTSETESVQEFNKSEIHNQIKNRHSPSLPVESKADRKSIQKRDTNEPHNEIIKYYVKYKIWNGSNAVDNHLTGENNFDVENTLKVLPIRKRSIENKKANNMRNMLNKIRQLQCKLNHNSKQPIRKLIKSIKVYRRKIFKNKKY